MSPRMRRRLSIGLAACSSAALLSSPLAAGGRLPVLVAALAGVAALAFFLARLRDACAAAYGAVALSTMPLFFVAVRTGSGDAVAMAASSIAISGLAVAVFDPRCGEGRSVRLGALALGVGGLVAGGAARGTLAVAAPALGVGIAWTLLGPRREALADGCGALALLAGSVALAMVAKAVILGGSAHVPFDAVVHRLGHALFPWSGFLPLAFIALVSPPSRRQPLTFAREEAARTVVLAAAVAAFGVHALDPRGVVPYTAPATLAAALALAARDLDRRGPPFSAGLHDATVVRTAGIVAALLTSLLARDLLDVPDRALAAVVPLRAGSSLISSGTWLRAAALVFAAILVLGAFDPPRPKERWIAPYLGWLRAIAQTWDGRLAIALCAVEVALGALAMVTVRTPVLGAIPRGFALHAFWAFPPAIVGAVWGPLAARDGLHALRRRARLPRGGAVIGAGTLAGALLAWGHYPALLAQAAACAAPSASTQHPLDGGISRDR